MQTTPAILLSVILSTAVATAICLTLRPAAEGANAEPSELQELRLAVRRMADEQRDLRKQLDAFTSQAAPTAAPLRSSQPNLSEEQVAAAVERHLASNPAIVAPASATPEQQAMDASAMFADLRGSANFWNRSDAWRKAHAAGKLEELLELFEKNAQAFPNDPSVQMDLANAYVAGIQLDQSLAPTYGMKVDQVYDKVLALDERHWEARFSKAVGYTFWPAFMGKGKEAMAHFETLVQQQDTMPVEEHHAETYLFYGNLLDQRGDTEKAREIWQRGLRRHPQHEELRGKLRQ